MWLMFDEGKANVNKRATSGIIDGTDKLPVRRGIISDYNLSSTKVLEYWHTILHQSHSCHGS